MLSTSVVIRTYTEERLNYLIKSIVSIRKQTVTPSEIILVVDHNPDLLREMRASFRDIVVVENRENRGSSGAWNSGVLAAQHDIIAFIDDDAEAAPDWLENLLYHYRTTSILGVGGTIQPVWDGGRPKWFPPEFDWVVGCTYQGMPLTTAPVRNLIGCNMSFRRSVFSEIGGFRKTLGHLGKLPCGDDETELCIRIHKVFPQHEILYEPKAKVYHNVTTARSTWMYFRRRCYLEGVSKARVSQLVGKKDALSSETTYVLKTLVKATTSSVLDGISGESDGFWRASSCIAGLILTVAGYVNGTISLTLEHLRDFVET